MFKKLTNPRKKEDSGRDDVDLVPSDTSSITSSLVPSSANDSLLDPSVSIPSRHKNSIDQQFQYQESGTTPLTSDPLGLNVIFRPPTDRKVDIIFVHGLGGTSRKSWSHNHDPDYFWPQIFLPGEPDLKEARLFTFGYDAGFRVGKQKSTVSILDFAKDLLYDLKYGQDGLGAAPLDLRMGEKPIIFVAHSMGGLIVKEAYMQGQNDGLFKDIIKSVSSIIFLSTPHRGTNLAEILNRILQVSFLSKPLQFIAELGAGSQTLRKLNEQFRHVAPNLDIVSFYETRPTPILKKGQIMVLEKDSSILGYPGEVSKSLDADHHGVAKFESPTDPRYIAVRNALKSLIGKSKAETDDAESSVNESSKLSLEEYLSIPESLDADYSFFRDRWTHGTCEWILKNESFVSWLQDTHSKPRVLWIHGNAASGKSVLSSFLIDHLIQLGLPCAYFFVRSTDRYKRMLSTILRALACQLAKSISPYAEQIRELETAATDLRTADFRNIWHWLYKQTLFHLEISHHMYWIIDGIDEAENPATIIKLFSELHLTTIAVRVIIVSRKTHEIASAIQKLGKDVHVEVIRTEGSQEDFRSYINQEMDIADQGIYKEEITNQLLGRARGNFLWVHLAVQKINTCHTKPAIEEALGDLPPGMEALYGRMAISVQTQPTEGDRRLARIILGWTTCSQRPLSVVEFCDAMGEDRLLEPHRAISDLCGGFVVVDKEGNVAMIHETAREYLLRGDSEDRPLGIKRGTTNDMLFKRCIARLTDPSLRTSINRNHPPALVEYASNSWFIHLLQGTVTDPDILDTAVKFLKGPHLLTWMNIVARRNTLNTLVTASRYLGDLALELRRVTSEETMLYHQAIYSIEGWATDLIKIVGKFGKNLTQSPDSIYKLIPPFCPKNSLIYQQFGRKESKSLFISGFDSNVWDDCLARFSLEYGARASRVIAAGNCIVVLASIRKSSTLFIYSSSTFEERRRINHSEQILGIQINGLGDLLVTYGYLTTRVWDITTGDCKKIIKNPSKRPRPRAIIFAENDQRILVVDDSRCIRSASLSDNLSEWTSKIYLEEKSLEGTTVNPPLCASLNQDGTMVALGYRGHPPTVWEIEPPMLIGQCNMSLDAADMTNQGSTWLMEVFQLSWHPYSGEVIGLTQIGLLFKWSPYDEEPNEMTQTGASNLAVSREGSLIATGDAEGTVKIFATMDFSLLYSLSSQEPVLSLAFSTDSKRLYDIRGVCGNVWEPNILVRFATSSEYADQNSDALSETESIARFALPAEHHVARVDKVIALSGQSVGPLYCYGTEEGVVTLGETGQGKVCELERLTGYMSIEQVAWSEDGKLVAFIDLNRRLSVKVISRNGQDRNTWQVDDGFQLALPSHQGHVSQLLFHPLGHRLFASTPSTLYAVDLDSHKLTQTTLSEELPGNLKWMFHSTLPNMLLGFGTDNLNIFDWDSLQWRETLLYSPPLRKSLVTGSATPITSSSSPPLHEINEGSLKAGRLVSDSDSPHILLAITSTDLLGQHETHYFVFEVEQIYPESRRDDAGNTSKELRYTFLPADIAKQVREPLALLSRGRLVFLDREGWMCICRLPGSQLAKIHGGRDSFSASVGIERFYFLPGDWLTANEAHLCTIMPDGTLLCPRTGDVGTVQYAKLRK